MRSSRRPRLISRVRSGGVVVSRAWIVKHGSSRGGLVQNRKLRVVGMPSRKAALLKKK